MSGLVIIGTGDHARVAFETASALSVSVESFVEPSSSRQVPATLNGRPVIRGFDQGIDSSSRFIVAIGANQVRAQLFARALSLGCDPAILVHPTAVILTGAEVGPGSHVCAAAIIGVDSRVGRNVIVNTSASIDHDGRIGDHAFVAPGSVLAGRVVVEEGAHIGIGSVVIEGRTIGRWSLVAAGATVISDVHPLTRVAGVPARPMAEVPREESVRD